MLVDLHAHYPMHVIPGKAGHASVPLRRWEAERWRARIVDLISRFRNYQGPDDEPSVTVPRLRDGRVGIALSVLYSPFDEIDLTQSYGAAPLEGYFQHLIDQIDLVEDDVEHQPDATLIRNATELATGLEAAERGDVALVHCVEGGFGLGATPGEVRANVATLARRGVAYVTLAHLFWRRVATNAPALPFLPDWAYRLLFPQPDEGLGELGAAAVEAMAEHGILVDVTHMGERSLADALDALEAAGGVPPIASHGACRLDGLAYNLPDWAISRVAEQGGVVGLILCTHYIAAGRRKPRSLDESIAALCAHVDHICQVTGSFDHVAIGSDLDGYIKPALPGLEHMGHMGDLQDRLAQHYGAANAERISSANALRMLHARFSGA